MSDLQDEEHVLIPIHRALRNTDNVKVKEPTNTMIC